MVGTSPGRQDDMAHAGEAGKGAGTAPRQAAAVGGWEAIAVRAIRLPNASLLAAVEFDDLGGGAGRHLEDKTPMKFSLSSRYAVRAVVAIAGHKGPRWVGAQEVAAEHGLPAQFVSKLLRLLVKAGLRQSLRGLNGGFSLARPTGAISLLAIMEGVNGPFRGEVPPSGGQGHVRLDRPLRLVADLAAETVRRHLRGTTVADLMATAEKRSASRS
jgi:Rrf2 family protein